jgi:hypothetical protein
MREAAKPFVEVRLAQGELTGLLVNIEGPALTARVAGRVAFVDG